MAAMELRAPNSAVEQLRREQGIRPIASTSGRCNLVVRLDSSETDSVYSSINKLRSMRGVRRTRTPIAFDGYSSGKQLGADETLALVCLNTQGHFEKVLESLKQTPAHSAHIAPGEFDIISTVCGRDPDESWNGPRRSPRYPARTVARRCSPTSPSGCRLPSQFFETIDCEANRASPHGTLPVV
jgi:hypothetical protein